MLCDNLKQYRKQRGMSQEELAVKLHVVRQTVSKWEKNLSVPDAEILVRISTILEVPVETLLSNPENPRPIKDLGPELARLNAELAQLQQQSQLARQAEQKRNQILFLSFAATALALGLQNQVLSLLLSGGCLLFALFLLYRNLALLTSVSTQDLRMGVLRKTTLFNLFILVVCIALSLLSVTGLLTLSEQNEKLAAVCIIGTVMVFSAIIGPRLPFSRHTGLRLPWTVSDEATWYYAHRILGIISLPLALLYAGCAFTVPYFEAVTLTAVLLWVGIPGLLSYLFYRRRMGLH